MRVRFTLLLLLVTAILSSLSAAAAITGTVITSDGAAISGAKVSLFAPETPAARRLRTLSKTPDRAPLVSVTTGSTGTFSLDTPKGQPLFDVRIEAAGYAPSSVRVLPDEEIGAEPLAAAPKKIGTITAGGKPVAGATVVWAGGEAEALAQTDANGKYSLPDPEKWATRVMVIHPDFAPLEEATGPFGDKKGVDRVLNAGVVVKGKVVAADGTTPVAKAAIMVDNWPLEISGEDGSFTLAHAPKEWAEVKAAASERAAARSRTKGDLTLKLAKPASVAGVARDGKTQQPLNGVEIRLSTTGPNGMLGGSAFTDAKGNYSISPVVPGIYQLSAMRPGYSQQPLSVSVTAGQAQQKVVFLQERARVSGTVVDEDKRPVAGVRLTARNNSRDPGLMMIGRFNQGGGASSGPDGRYVVRGTDPGPEVVVDAARRGLPSARTAAMKLVAGEKKTGVNVVIPRGISFAGTVTDPQGKPLSGVSIDAAEAEGGGGFPGGNIQRRLMISANRGGDDQLVRTGSDGKFSMKLKEGTYDVSFKREGFAVKNLRGQQVNATTKPVEVKLDLGVEITGRVTRGGMPVENVNVGAMSQDGFNNTQSGPDGTFHITDLTPGQYMLTVNKFDAFIQTMRSIAAPATDVNIELPSGGRISGHVVDKSTHQPVTAFQAGVTTSRGGGGMMVMMPPMTRQFTSDDGSFTLENVPPGQTQLVVNAAGYTTGRMAGLTIEDGKSLDSVEVGLETGVKLTGRVTGPDGAPLSGVTVREDAMAPGGRVMRASFGGEGAIVTDPNGEYTMDALEPGEKTLMFNLSGYLGETKTVTLSSKETRLDVQLSTGKPVSGQVVSEAGGPVGDVTVAASSAAEGFGQRSVHTDANGNFQFEGLAPGHYTFTASKPGFASGVIRDFDIALGAPVRVIMKSGGIITGHVTGLTDREIGTATVQANGSGGGNASAAVDSSGNYRIEGAPTGTVRVSARTGQMFGAGSKSTAVKSVQVEGGATVTADLEFKTDTVIRGRVTRNGRPLASAMVAFFPKAGRAQTTASTSTDGSGGYEVTGLDAAQYSVQIVDMDRITPFTTTYEVKGSGTFDIDATGASVHGRVVDSTSGQAVVDAHVEIRGRGTEGFLAGRGAQTDANGNFSIESVSAGAYAATVEKSGYGSDTKDLNVGNSDSDLQFSIAASSGVTLNVVDARDQRLLAANVTVVDAQGRQIDSPFMRFTNPQPVKLTLAPGIYKITVSAQGYAPRTMTITAPSEQNVALSPGGSLLVRSKASTMVMARLIDAAGNTYTRGPFAAPMIQLNPTPGTTLVPNIVSGVYTLQVLDGDRVVKSTTVNIVDGQQVEVSI
jgi:protocatechuate 3,4-dioxygenase beta subunit